MFCVTCSHALMVSAVFHVSVVLFKVGETEVKLVQGRGVWGRAHLCYVRDALPHGVGVVFF